MKRFLMIATLVAAASLLVSTQPPVAALQATLAGHLTVRNDLALVDGHCVGGVTIVYGVRAVDFAAAAQAKMRSDCSVVPSFGWTQPTQQIHGPVVGGAYEVKTSAWDECEAGCGNTIPAPWIDAALTMVGCGATGTLLGYDQGESVDGWYYHAHQAPSTYLDTASCEGGIAGTFWQHSPYAEWQHVWEVPVYSMLDSHGYPDCQARAFYHGGGPVWEYPLYNVQCQWGEYLAPIDASQPWLNLAPVAAGQTGDFVIAPHA